jgi:hypothetical protein
MLIPRTQAQVIATTLVLKTDYVSEHDHVHFRVDHEDVADQAMPGLINTSSARLDPL